MTVLSDLDRVISTAGASFYIHVIELQNHYALRDGNVPSAVSIVGIFIRVVGGRDGASFAIQVSSA